MADELEADTNDPNYPPIVDCSYLCDNNTSNKIVGSRVLCNNSSYTVSNSQRLQVSWSILTGTDKVNLSSSGNTAQLNAISGKRGYITLGAELTSENCSLQASALKTKQIWVGKPRVIITSSYSDPTNALSFTILLDDMEGQGITQVQWVKTGGNGNLQPFGNTAAVSGPSSGWIVEGIVKATNYCGTTQKTFSIGGGGFEFDDGNTALMRVNTTTYKVFDKKKRTYNIPELQSIEVFDIYGNPVMRTTINNIDLSGESSGAYIIHATIGNDYLTTKIAHQ